MERVDGEIEGCRYIQHTGVNNGVLHFLYYGEDIYVMVLSVFVSILDPNHMYLPLLLTVYCDTMLWPCRHRLCDSILLPSCLMMHYNLFVFAVFLVSLHGD